MDKKVVFSVTSFYEFSTKCADVKFEKSLAKMWTKVYGLLFSLMHLKFVFLFSSLFVKIFVLILSLLCMYIGYAICIAYSI